MNSLIAFFGLVAGASALSNAGADCWSGCGDQAGKCDGTTGSTGSFCGTDGWCCKAGYSPANGCGAGVGCGGNHCCVAQTSSPTTSAPVLTPAPTTLAPTAPTNDAPSFAPGTTPEDVNTADCEPYNTMTDKSAARAGCNAEENCRWRGAKKWGECGLKDDVVAALTPTGAPVTAESARLAAAQQACSFYKKRRYCRYKKNAKANHCLWVDNQCIASTASPTDSGDTPANACVNLLKGDCFTSATCSWDKVRHECFPIADTLSPTAPTTSSPTTVAFNNCEQYKATTKNSWLRGEMRRQCMAQPTCMWRGGARRGFCVVRN